MNEQKTNFEETLSFLSFTSYLLPRFFYEEKVKPCFVSTKSIGYQKDELYEKRIGYQKNKISELVIGYQK